MGSNSFHMVVAEERQGQLIILDRIRDMVRLAAGLDEQGQLSPDVEKNALECLQRYGQRLRDLHSQSVSAVGTNTLRRTQNADRFLQKAEQMLGHPIEIISGIEEARLIYQGVAHTLEADHKDRLVIDIGGGSTELILGEDFKPGMMESLEMGCVTMTQRYFADGKITGHRIEQARINVLQKMRSIRHAFRHQGWDVVIGSSGTIKSTASVIEQLELNGQGGIGLDALKKMLEKLAEFDHIDDIALDGLQERRAPVFLGGVIVLLGVFEALEIEQMQVSDGAVREGLLYDMLGRRQNKDIRNQSVEKLASRFHTDQQHSQRIEHTLCDFMQQAYEDWGLPYQQAQTLLLWACEVHEIGRDISHSSYHRHSSYIIENADLAGFSQQEQKRLASLVRFHRGKITSKQFELLNESCQQLVSRLAILFRLAIIFHRSRSATALPVIGLSVGQGWIKIQIPQDWLQQHPLTLNDLEQEAEYLQAVDIQLSVDATT